MPTTPFPHQERAVNSAWALYESGRRKVCITTCCGGGKTRTAVYIIKEAMQKILAVSSTGQVRVCFMGHRKLLVSQTSRVFTEEEIEHGIRAADFPENFDIPIQISSRDTEISRCLGKKARWSVPQLDLLIIDERHVNKAGKIIELEDRRFTCRVKCLLQTCSTSQCSSETR
jgi:superfamily II DNA or RNA helicase